MTIKTVGIIGLGALGTLYAEFFNSKLPQGSCLVIADTQHIEKYERQGVLFNGRSLELCYVDKQVENIKCDLIIICTKYMQLNSALMDIKNFVGENTLIISVINGIKSEQEIARVYGTEKVINCVAQSMGALKLGNDLLCDNMGHLSIGEMDDKMTPRLSRLAAFFEELHFPYEIPPQMARKIWGKLMINTGCNQICAAYNCNYDRLQADTLERSLYWAVMDEVIKVANAEGVPLDDGDKQYWIDITNSLNPASMPSMRQDVLNKRPMEIELFSGTIRQIGKRHGIGTPLNDALYEQLYAIQDAYLEK